ncbi:MAG: hypothetical protein F4X64_06010 [Chloroflexi bacterium]|nr:hypothetical protein [Chloroflexota bacterium]
MEPIFALVGFVVTIVVFVVTIVGAVLYLRADARANRQEWKAESEANRQEWKAETETNRREWKTELEANRQEWKADLATVLDAINGVKDDVAQLDRRLTALEVKVDAMAEKLDTKAEESTVQRNHRELLIRLAFHHHGDGRYPVVAATDPEPVNPTDGDV